MKNKQIPIESQEDILFFPDYVKIDEMLRYGCTRFWRNSWVCTYTHKRKTESDE